MHKLSDDVNRKFIETIDIDEWEVETEDGFVDIKKLHKTIPYEVWNIQLENGLSLKCADTHILITENYDEVFAQDSLGKSIRTKDGISKVISVENLGYSENMYDLEIDSDKHTYYTNDILSHNTTSTIAAIIHYVIFNSEKTVAILANKGDTAREILDRIQLAYENLPKWLQQGVAVYNRGKLELENNSRIIAGSTSSSAIRGYSISLLFIDETAFIENWNEFYKSVYPTIASGLDSKVVLVSTPNGINFFHDIWKGAVEGTNSYVPIKVTWQDVPGRDEKWKAETIANTSMEAFIQEHEVEFIGSSGTLIDGWKLKELKNWEPISKNNYTSIYEVPEKDSEYILVADVSLGKGIDNSAFTVIKTSALPYKVVATYYCPNIPPDMYAEVIYQAHKYYNDAYVVVENNGPGCETLRVLHDTYECETLLGMQQNNMYGDKRRLAIGGGLNFELGIKTTKSNKPIGCSRLKTLIEQNTLVFGDKNIIDELNRFSRKGNTYQAEAGSHDDIVMTLVIFAWLTTQDIFVGLTNIEVRENIREEYEERFEEELAPFGYVFDGINDTDGMFTIDNQMERELLGYNTKLPDYKDLLEMRGIDADEITVFPIPTLRK